MMMIKNKLKDGKPIEITQKMQREIKQIHSC